MNEARTVGSADDGLILKLTKNRKELVEYLTDLTGDDFARTALYLDGAEMGRARLFEAANFHSQTSAGVIAEMRATENRPRLRAGTRSVYHLIGSLGGKDDPAVVMAALKRAVELMGLAQQRAVFAVHDDTDNIHGHAAIDAVHQNGRQIILEKGYTHILLAHINAQVCFEFGLTPLAGLGFYANERGVFRSADGHQVRDANFEKVTRDLRRLDPAKTILSAKQEAETGRQSLQSYATDVFNTELHDVASIYALIAALAAEGVDYRLAKSGATMTIEGVTFKASQISPKATPVKLAARLGIEHLTATKAHKLGLGDRPGFFSRDDDGGLTPITLPAPRCLDHAPTTLPLQGEVAAEARAHSERRRAEEERFPQYTPSQTVVLRRRIADEKMWLKVDFDDPDHDDARWRLDRLVEAQRRMQGHTRGRPPKRRSSPSIDLPTIPGNGTDGVILYSRPEPGWWIESWRAGDKIVPSTGGRKTVYRGKKVVATFSAELVTLHNMDEADHRAALLQAKKQFGSDLRIYGDAKFRRQMTRIAIEEGIVLANPELAAYQNWLLIPMRQAFDRLAKRLGPAMHRVIDKAKTDVLVAQDALQWIAREQFDGKREAVHRLGTSLGRLGPVLAARLAEQKAEQRRIEEQAAATDHQRALAAEQAQRARDAEAASFAAEARRKDDELTEQERKRAEEQRTKADRAQALAARQEREAQERALIFDALRKGKLVIMKAGDRIFVCNPASRSEHTKATAMLADGPLRAAMFVHARAYREAVAARDAKAKADADKALRLQLALLKSEADQITAGNRQRPFLNGAAISKAEDVIRAFGRSWNVAEDRVFRERDEIALMYARWDAEDAIKEGKASGEVVDRTLNVHRFSDGEILSFALNLADEPEARELVNTARTKIGAIMSAASEGLIVVGPDGQPLATDRTAEDLARRAGYFWHLEKPRSLMLEEIAVAEADAAERKARIERADAAQPGKGTSEPKLVETVPVSQPSQTADPAMSEPEKKPEYPPQPPPGWGQGFGR